MKVAIIGDSFIDEYIYGDVERISPEAPVPVLDVTRKEQRGGGAINVANNLFGLEINFTLFTIIDELFKNSLPYDIKTPSNVVSLKKTRFVGNNYQLVRVDEPKFYRQEDIIKFFLMIKETNFADFDFIAFSDYNKGTVKRGKVTIVDSKKKDLRCFRGSEYLKVNLKEWENAINKESFPNAFVTAGRRGIDFYQKGKFRINEPTQAREVVDTSGAGDTVMAIIIYCLINKIKDPKQIMQLANKGASVVISKFGTTPITLKELIQ